MLLRVTLFAIGLITAAVFALPVVSEKHSHAYRYLQAYQRPESVVLCHGALPQWVRFKDGNRLEPLLVGFVPEHDPNLFKREVRKALQSAGYEVTQKASMDSGATWYLQLKHRLRTEERVLMLRHHRSALRASHWCYFKTGASEVAQAATRKAGA